MCVSKFGQTASNIRTNDDLENTLKETKRSFGLVQVLSLRLYGETVENHEKPSEQIV